MADTVSKKKSLKPTQETVARVFTAQGEEKGTFSLPGMIFNVVASATLLAQYVRVYLSNQRQGTHKTKTRGEVSGSTKKIYRQKGTGRARHGAKMAPIFVGGGIAHGPSVRTHALSMNKKQRQKALYRGLTLKAEQNKVLVVEGISAFKGKTKEMASLMKTMNLEPQKTLVVYSPEQAELFQKLMSNVNDARTSQDRLMNAYDVLRADTLVFTHEALNDFLAFREATK